MGKQAKAKAVRREARLVEGRERRKVRAMRMIRSRAFRELWTRECRGLDARVEMHREAAAGRARTVLVKLGAQLDELVVRVGYRDVDPGKGEGQVGVWVE